MQSERFIQENMAEQIKAKLREQGIETYGEEETKIWDYLEIEEVIV